MVMDMLGRGLNVLKGNQDFRGGIGKFLDANRDVGTQKRLNSNLSAEKLDVYTKQHDADFRNMSAQAIAGRSDKTVAQSLRKSELSSEEKKRMDAVIAKEGNVNEGKLTESGMSEMQQGQATALEQHKMARSNAAGKVWDDTKDYFVGGSFTENAARIGAATAAVGGVAVGTRYMSGGSVSHNNQGRRDIAGIPFI